MDRWIEVLAILGGGISAITISVWLQDRFMKREARVFYERTAEQDKDVSLAGRGERTPGRAVPP